MGDRFADYQNVIGDLNSSILYILCQAEDQPDQVFEYKYLRISMICVEE